MGKLAPLETPTPILRNLPLAFLIAANLIPVLGVLLWEWSVFEIVVLYWFENVVIGVVNILKLAAVTGDLRNPNDNHSSANKGKVFLISRLWRFFQGSAHFSKKTIATPSQAG